MKKDRKHCHEFVDFSIFALKLHEILYMHLKNVGSRRITKSTGLGHRNLVNAIQHSA